MYMTAARKLKNEEKSGCLNIQLRTWKTKFYQQKFRCCNICILVLKGRLSWFLLKDSSTVKESETVLKRIKNLFMTLILSIRQIYLLKLLTLCIFKCHVYWMTLLKMTFDFSRQTKVQARMTAINFLILSFKDNLVKKVKKYLLISKLLIFQSTLQTFLIITI